MQITYIDVKYKHVGNLVTKTALNVLVIFLGQNKYLTAHLPRVHV